VNGWKIRMVVVDDASSLHAASRGRSICRAGVFAVKSLVRSALAVPVYAGNEVASGVPTIGGLRRVRADPSNNPVSGYAAARIRTLIRLYTSVPSATLGRRGATKAAPRRMQYFSSRQMHRRL